ncbi:AAA family ATPase [Pseudarthrobacter sp. NIBRBAC000502770]|uniref:AAA family ATPase n=1 Tax=Pseudarthrobacter sp. NIBRBAC000502770 TaxID=2590785 RepID=UPI00113FEA9D|nr:AAA family ATPase [Pseudarthrobacter sp. NIBRBAC000502770]QDG87527.1 ATP-binding protein [Pseudarthrobacter sp. NIBRBAC000502770]
MDFDAGRTKSPINADGSESWTTVLTGRNGGGKSRTLGALTTLLTEGRGGRIRIRKPENLWKVVYFVGNTRYTVRNDRRGYLAVYRDGRQVPFEGGAEFPSRVIAVTAAANDKFPNVRRSPYEDDTYYYFGLRDATNRASGVAPLLAALQALTAAKAGDARRIKAVATVFALLGYHPYLRQQYGMRYSKLLSEDVSLSMLYEAGALGVDARTRIGRLLHRDPSVLEQLEAAWEVLRVHMLRGSIWEIEVDFSHGDGGDLEESRLFDSADLLRRAGLLRLQSVYLSTLKDGSLVDLRDASSGQISLATTFLSIAASITQGSLILIDEPEISLHPEWQTAYLGLARRLFSDYAGCHFVIATHSPSVVSGMPGTSANAISLDPEHRNVEADSNYGGNSIDELLVQEFGVYESGNLFLQKEVAKALDLASTGEIASDAFAKAAKTIAPAATELEGEPFGMLISSLLRAAERVKAEQRGADSR